MGKSRQNRRERRQLARQEAARLAEAHRFTLDTDPDASLLETQERRVIFSQRSEVHSGPLPHPASLAAYANISPTLVDRIVTMAERQAGHRQNMELTYLQGEISSRRHSTNAALAVAALGFATTAFLGWTNNEVAASIVGGLDIVGLVSIFVYGRKKQPKRKQPDEKSAKEPEKGEE